MIYLQTTLLLFLLAFWTSLSQAVPSNWKFKTLRSPHFEIVYRADQKALAKRYAIAAELAHELLIPIFKEGPYKTIVVIKDATDLSNGLANFLPYPHIVVYPVLPNNLDSIDDYGDWALEMMLHEYAHILNMYPAHSFYAPLKWIFGSVVRPNAVLPRWYLEGLAVNAESWFSTHGRLRSSSSDAAARALALGNKLQVEDIATINESSIGNWPYGSRPYVYGGWWHRQIIQDHGFEVLQTWNQNFSRRLPFFLNDPIREQTQYSATDFTKLILEQQTKFAQAQIDLIRTTPTHQAEAIVASNGEQSVFAVSPGGNHLVYCQSTPKSGTSIFIKTRSEAKQKFSLIEGRLLFKSYATTKISWLNENQFVFDQVDLNSPEQDYRDLYLFDLAHSKTTQITFLERAQEPSPSLSGKQITYIQNEGGKTKLKILNLETNSTATILSGSLYQRISNPIFYNDNELLFSLRQKTGIEQIYVYNFTTKKTQLWLGQLKSAQHLKKSSQGILVTDDNTGARNIYLIKNAQAQAVSNTLTEIESLDYDPQLNQIIFSELTPAGRRLFSMDFKRYSLSNIQLSSLPAPPAQPKVKFKLEEESFIPLAYLWPRYWIPFIYQVEEGFIFQGLTSNQDPIGRNQYSLMAAYDTVTSKPSYGVSYSNHSLPTEIGLSYAKSVSYLGASGLTLESEGAGMTFAQYWPFNRRHIRWSLGGTWDQTERTTTTYRRIGPQAVWRYSKLDHPLNERWGFQTEFKHNQYLVQDDYLAYGRSALAMTTQWTSEGGKKVLLNARGSLAPDLPLGSPTTSLGDRSVGGNYLISLTNSDYLLRGYPSGTFIGRKTVNANLEYILPGWTLNKGFGTFPLFLKGIELAAFVDTLAVDGAAFEETQEAYKFSTLGEFYTSTGLEFRLSTTTGYHLPLALTFGLYYGLNDRFGGGLSPFFGLGFGSLGGLENKTP